MVVLIWLGDLMLKEEIGGLELMISPKVQATLSICLFF